jgi:UDP-2-acetamido-2,6-beta-L-arabino-hexul-4-ose reductase
VIAKKKSSMKIGITGQAGFVGYHLFQTLNLDDTFTLIPFERNFFENEIALENFVQQCEVIIHLAAMNRHENPQVIYDTNLDLVTKLISACEKTRVAPHIIFSSSLQETRDNLYGKSKKDGKEKLMNWAVEANGVITSLTIPNVFGPFGRPNYNSVVATFCHKLTHGETPKIIKDSEIGLIYINELVACIRDVILKNVATEMIGINSHQLEIAPTSYHKVSAILKLLESYKNDYLEKGIFPDLNDPFKKALFNTFRCYIPEGHYPVKFTEHTDNRGLFVEIARTRTSGQFSFSTTVPGITRGNHFHTRKAERFAVISGKAQIQLRKIGTDHVINYELDGKEPSYVDMPIWYTHNIKNIGNTELITLFWINEPYDANDPDTYFVNV